MVDLCHLAEKASSLLPESSANVLSALGDCVLYKVVGQYRKEARGLSCFYSYDGDLENYTLYNRLGADSAFKYFFAYELTGALDESGMAYLSQWDISELPDVKTLPDMGWDGIGLSLDEEGCAVLELGPEADQLLSDLTFRLYAVNEEADLMLLLGTDNDIVADWENGIFRDNFRGVWGSIDGTPVYMELAFAGDDYNLYSVPVLLNGEAYNLQVVYDFTAEQWSILGARGGIDESGMADKELRLLEMGDTLSIIYYMTSCTGEEGFAPYTVAELTVSDETAFAETALSDGHYVMVFEMWDAMGNAAVSDSVAFDCSGGEIITTVN